MPCFVGDNEQCIILDVFVRFLLDLKNEYSRS